MRASKRLSKFWSISRIFRHWSGLIAAGLVLSFALEAVAQDEFKSLSDEALLNRCRLAFAGSSETTKKTPTPDPAYQELVRRIRHGSILETSEFLQKAYPVIESLPSEFRQKLAQLLVHEYYNLPKEPNRRHVELFIKLFLRIDERFHAAVKHGSSVRDAYDRSMRDMQILLANSNSFSFDDVLAVADDLKSLLGKSDTAFIIGSFADGKSQIGRSDIDIKFIHPDWSKSPFVSPWFNRLPWFVRSRFIFRFEDRLKAKIQNRISARYPQVSTEIAVNNITAGNVFGPDAWKAFGLINTFVVEIGAQGLILHVFDPLGNINQSYPL